MKAGTGARLMLGLLLVLILAASVGAWTLDEIGGQLDFAPMLVQASEPDWVTSFSVYAQVEFTTGSRLRASLGSALDRWIPRISFEFTQARPERLGLALDLHWASIPNDRNAAELGIGARYRLVENEMWRIGLSSMPFAIGRFKSATDAGWDVFASSNLTTDIQIIIADRMSIGQELTLLIPDYRPVGEPLLPGGHETGLVSHIRVFGGFKP